jgi:deoxyribose-phosphate aldolase
MLTRKEFCSRIDFARLTHSHSREDMEAACKTALAYGFAALCINPCEVAFCKKLLKGTNVKVGTVIGYPLGVNTTETKVFEAVNAIKNGADELDVVINVSRFKDGDYEYVLDELKQVIQAAKAKKPDVLVKVIIERFYISDEELPKICEIVIASGADYIKQATGYAPKDLADGVADIKMIKAIVGNRIQIKSAFGCGETLKEFAEAAEAGADRIGTPIADIKLDETPDTFWNR